MVDSMDDLAPFLKPPLTFRDGRVSTCSLEESIGQNIRVLLSSPIQGMAKSREVAAVADYGSDLPHHRFSQGGAGELVRQVKLAIRRHEPRFSLDKIEFTSDEPGRYLSHRYIRIIGKVKETGLPLEMEFDVEA
jgi:phage baseplate assembly protein W